MKSELFLPTELICGYFDCSTFGALKVSPERKCTMFEIEYFLEDGENMYSNGIAYQMRRNHVYIASPNEERYSELPFKTKYIKFAAEGRLAEILSGVPKYFRVYRSYEAIALLDDIIMLYTMAERDELLLHGKILSYISLIVEEARNTQTVASYKKRLIMTAKTFIEEYFGEDIKLSDIAKEVSLSPNYFHTLFSEVCGFTPREYLTEHRVNMAKKYLLTTQMSVCEVAERCGFKTQQYMTSVFKSSVGMTPVSFRQQHQNEYFR